MISFVAIALIFLALSCLVIVAASFFAAIALTFLALTCLAIVAACIFVRNIPTCIRHQGNKARTKAGRVTQAWIATVVQKTSYHFPKYVDSKSADPKKLSISFSFDDWASNTACKILKNSKSIPSPKKLMTMQKPITMIAEPLLPPIVRVLPPFNRRSADKKQIFVTSPLDDWACITACKILKFSKSDVVGKLPTIGKPIPTTDYPRLLSTSLVRVRPAFDHSLMLFSTFTMSLIFDQSTSSRPGETTRKEGRKCCQDGVGKSNSTVASVATTPSRPGEITGNEGGQCGHRDGLAPGEITGKANRRTKLIKKKKKKKSLRMRWAKLVKKTKNLKRAVRRVFGKKHRIRKHPKEDSVADTIELSPSSHHSNMDEEYVPSIQHA